LGTYYNKFLNLWPEINALKDSISKDTGGNFYVFYNEVYFMVQKIINFLTANLTLPNQIPEILTELVEEKKLEQQGSKFILCESMKKFIEWCVDEKYIDNTGEDQTLLTAEMIFNYIEPQKKLDTIERYIRDTKPLE